MNRQEVLVEVLRQELPAVLAAGGLSVVFLPIVGLLDRRAVCMEALLRWAHPREGQIPAARILAAALGTPMIYQVAPIVLAAALRMAERSPPELQVSVNACAAEVAEPEFLAFVEAALRPTSVGPDRLLVEIDAQTVATETARRCCQALHGLGVQVVIDDCRLGDWEALEGLMPLLNGVKIHPRLVASIGLDRAAEAEIAEIVRRTTEAGIGVSAERVETESQASFLASAGCRFAQGWLFGPPRPDPFGGQNKAPR